MNEIRKIYERVAEEYKSLELKRTSSFYHEYWVNKLIKLININNEYRKILDYGCGSGIVMKCLNNILNESKLFIVGIDISKNMLKVAKEKNVGELVLGDVTNCGFKDKCFDVVISRGVLYLLDNKNNAIKEVNRILKDGGIFVISEPNDNIFLGIIRRLLRFKKDRFGKYQGLQKSNLKEILHNNNFLILVERYFGYLAFPCAFPEILPIYIPLFIIKILIKLDSIISKIPYINKIGWHFIIVAKKVKTS